MCVCVRERCRCLLCVTAAACGEEEDERSLPLRFLDCVFLSYSGIVYNLWAVVVFPTIVGFSTLHLVSPHYFCFLCLFRAYILYIRLWPNVLVEQIPSKWYQSIGFEGEMDDR